MFEAISRLYEKTGSKTVVKNAVLKGWITEEDYKTITCEEYSL